MKALTRFKLSENLVCMYGCILLLLTLIAGIRVVGLNYNSASIDEAIYIMIGRLGIFQHDWWSYNPSTWLAGLPFIYPTIAATTYMAGGITASRLFNLVLSLLMIIGVMSLTYQIYSRSSPGKKLTAVLFAGAIAGFASIGIVVSRLATYDIPSYYLLIISLIFSIKASISSETHGRNYFLAALLLSLAVLTKIIIAVYIPFMVLLTWFQARQNPNRLPLWRHYYLFPLFLILGLYVLTNYPSLLTYAVANTTRTKTSLIGIFQTIWPHLRYVFGFWLLASIGLIRGGYIRIWLWYTFLSLLIILPHFVTQRALWTMEKQSFLTIALLAPIIGIGLVEVITRFKLKLTKAVAFSIITLLIGVYAFRSYGETKKYNRLWQDTRPFTPIIKSYVRPGEKILTESGAPFILATYDFVNPLDISTLDWFEYRQTTGETAYTAATRDAYFDLIQLNGADADSTSFNSLRGLIISELQDNYQAVYSESNYVLYRRKS